MYSKILSEEDDIRMHPMLLKHMEKLEQFSPMYLLKLTLKHELLNYMKMKDQEIEEASDTMNSQKIAKLRKQSLPLSEMVQDLELMPIMIEHQLMDIYVHLPEALSEDLEERTLKTIQDLATQMHHIFPVSDFPKIADYLENLIALTPTQHFVYAHPKNNTKYIDRKYQYLCLVAKTGTIRENLVMNTGSPVIYDFNLFLKVLSIGLGNDEFYKVPNLDFDTLLGQIEQYCETML